MKTLLLVGVLLLSVASLAQLILSWQFTSKISDLGRRLASLQVNDTDAMAPLPAVMYDFAIRNGGRSGGPSVVKMIQSAEMRLAPDQPFFKLRASQVSGTRRADFVWQADGTMNAIVPLRILDSFVDGVGLLEVRVAGSIIVASATDKETAKGEAMRFLAELPWNPDAILNARGLRWQQGDASSVDVSMNTAGGVALVTLRLNSAGDVIGVDAADRPRVGDTPARWLGPFHDYVQVGQYRFPSRGEIGWDLPAGEFIYWKGKVLSVSSN